MFRHTCWKAHSSALCACLVPAALRLRLVQQLVGVLFFVGNLVLEVRRVPEQQCCAVLFPPQENPEPGRSRAPVAGTSAEQRSIQP